jgi:predicted DNA-binding antitoxin AbrB/MazE fold protein
MIWAEPPVAQASLAWSEGQWYGYSMIATVEAIYENGLLKLPHPLPLKDNTHVLVRIQSKEEGSDTGEREAWLKLSEETLSKAWNNPADDVFNELLDG